MKSNLIKNDPKDALMYATFVSTAFRERNPFRQFLQEITRRVRNMLFFRQNLQAITTRREQLEHRLEYIRVQIEDPAHHPQGHRIDKLR